MRYRTRLTGVCNPTLCASVLCRVLLISARHHLGRLSWEFLERTFERPTAHGALIASNIRAIPLSLLQPVNHGFRLTGHSPWIKYKLGICATCLEPNCAADVTVADSIGVLREHRSGLEDLNIDECKTTPSREGAQQ